MWSFCLSDTLGRQDIQAARIIIERFIIQIELGYDEVRIRYRYPLGAGMGRGSEKEIVEVEPVDLRNVESYRLHTVEKKTIREITDIYQLSEIRVWNICTSIRKKEEPPLNC